MKLHVDQIARGRERLCFRTTKEGGDGWISSMWPKNQKKHEMFQSSFATTIIDSFWVGYYQQPIQPAVRRKVIHCKIRGILLQVHELWAHNFTRQLYEAKRIFM